MTRLEEIKYEVHLAVLAAMDTILARELGKFNGKPITIKDKHLPALLPALDHAIEGAMREVYDLLPESLDIAEADVVRTREQLERSLANLEALEDVK